MGRKISVYLDDPILEFLDRYSTDLEVSRSGFLRVLLSSLLTDDTMRHGEYRQLVVNARDRAKEKARQ